jgi:hypothetical protein
MSSTSACCGQRSVVISAVSVRGQLAREYDAAIARLDADEAAALAPTDSPLQRVVEAGYVNLPLRWKAWVEGDDAETRQWALRFAVAVLRRALVLEARDQRGPCGPWSPPFVRLPVRSRRGSVRGCTWRCWKADWDGHSTARSAFAGPAAKLQRVVMSGEHGQ